MVGHEFTAAGVTYVWNGQGWGVKGGGSGSTSGAATDITLIPVGNIEAINVQAAIEELDTEKVAKAGDAMAGALLLLDPTDPAHAAHKGYVDAQISAGTATSVPNTRTLTAGAGLVGGGDLTANRTFDVGAGNGITVAADAVSLTVPVSTANGGTGTTTGISAATQTALNLKEDKANKGIASGYASLDTGGKVPAAQLPAYVDDILEFANLAAFPATGTAGVLYVALDTNKVYRWSGSIYVEVSPDSGAPSASDLVPVMDGVAAAGTSVLYSRGDHKHPSDTAKLDVTHAGTGGAAHAAVTTGANGFMIAADKTKLDGISAGAGVATPPATVAPLMNGVAAVGTTTKYAREDHVHPSDTSRATTTYVDTQDALRVLKAGDTMTGHLSLPITPAAANAVRKDYVDTAVATKEPLLPAGGTAANWLRGDKTWQVLPPTTWGSITGIPATFPPSAHVHPQSEITNLVADLALKAPLASPAFTGNPTAPTPTAGDADTTVATTAFVMNAVTAAGGAAPSDAVPLMNGAAAAGTSALYSRGDHKHPTDTSLAAVTYVNAQDALKVSKTGDAMTGVLTSTVEFRVTGSHLGMFTCYAPSGTAYGLIGQLAGGFAINATNQNMYFVMGGTARWTLDTNGSLSCVAPGGLSAALYVQGGSATYTQDNRCPSQPGGAGIFWSTNTTYYGITGFYSGAYYSFYGNIGAYITSGVWAASDARLKTVTGNYDSAAALAAVNALLVKEYAPSSPAAREMLNSRADGDDIKYGWIAQEVEQVLPIAVRDIEVPAVDRVQRAALRRVPVPELDSVEAKSLGEENVIIKAINDRYMLATLWSAVQQLSADNTALAARVAVLEGATP